jgi:hypothetical protein
MGFRAALHQAGAAALTQLLQFVVPAADQRSIPCPESSDILLHLAGVNEYRGLRVVGDAIWKACGGSHQFDGPHGS